MFVRARRSADSNNGPLRTIMANMLGINTFDAEATSIALIENTVFSITDGGLRPIYACQAQFNMAMADGIPENNVIRIYGDHLTVDGVGNIPGCPLPGSGNWGFADFRDCGPGAPSNRVMRDWVRFGYDGTVNTGTCYSTQPGNFLNGGNDVGDAFEALIGQTILIPLYDTYSGGGSNTAVNVSAFAGFQITQVVRNGSASERHIVGRFTRALCREGCSTGPNPGNAPGGAIVRIRLAAKS